VQDQSVEFDIFEDKNVSAIIPIEFGYPFSATSEWEGRNAIEMTPQMEELYVKMTLPKKRKKRALGEEFREFNADFRFDMQMRFLACENEKATNRVKLLHDVLNGKTTAPADMHISVIYIKIIKYNMFYNSYEHWSPTRLL